ncbi:hypothetical protein FRC20_002485 [Serendipita sp. 405]|nr:hypothetical protein FRC20_002485 [Serendipita sp. 405]
MMLRAALVSLVAFASLAATTPLKRAPNLVVSLSTTSPAIESLDGLTLTAKVENTASCTTHMPIMPSHDSHP